MYVGDCVVPTALPSKVSERRPPRMFTSSRIEVQIGEIRCVAAVADFETICSGTRSFVANGYQMMPSFLIGQLNLARRLLELRLVDQFVPRRCLRVPNADAVRQITGDVIAVFAGRIGGPVELKPDLFARLRCHATECRRILIAGVVKQRLPTWLGAEFFDRDEVVQVNFVSRFMPLFSVASAKRATVTSGQYSSTFFHHSAVSSVV